MTRARRYARVYALTLISVGASGFIVTPPAIEPAKQQALVQEFHRRREARAARQARGRG